MALQALQDDPKLSMRHAAKIYDVNRNTLSNRKKGKQARCNTISKSQNLSNLEEEAVLQYVLDQDMRGFPCQLSIVEDIANRLLADRGEQPVGKNWANNFINRQPELKSRYQRKYDYQRALCEDPITIRNWFRLVENTIAKYGIRSDDIWNFDETGFMMGMISTRKVITSAERRGRPKAVQPGSREWVTVIEAVSAEGQSIPPFIIVKGKKHLRSWYEESNLPADWAIALSENGWTNNQLGLNWLEHFNKHTTNRSTGPYRLLILDGHESHQSTEFQEYCKEKNIIPLYMPPHSSHILQPLDVGCFGPLKQAYSREIEGLMRRRRTHITKTQFFPAFYAAHQATIIRRNIKGGFRGAGLAPFNPEHVISKLDVQLRTPTPPREVTEPSTPWASRTPKTILETQSHSKYLQGRIRNHKSSSPESIIQAVKYFEKGQSILLHKLALQEAEIRELREENAANSRRKRVKRTQLQDNGRMTIGIGQSQIDQMDVDTQVVAESSRNGGQGRSVGLGVRHCSVCGKTGHNARTCQEVIKVTEDRDNNQF
ncbi:Pogo transposable element with ZNF domain [Fusarium oxysporum f. sp. conglutinans]|nr:Pogo transposable element with ZNF domain [Fusarium oxysporum f. sp. conglutinans]KAG6981885.1 Pogo transposable element with ZNF domain [Fusarium oxysporum f. sp. conglutinans]KAG6982641.1 Pogo transposable element with ZNF domain [Fusarium oxysporum f. sp. conglutinans]KAG6985877.1 Pogo transposable element with ZNF domain [Fusarium oxysporum f. sp. conglutinans]KAG6988793.1 Pogo transposable element with ZNF domain [Fusarium oxysporum f. sp. conglutinans]